MRIAYLIHWNEGPESGVFKKVTGQMTEWIRLGHEAALYLLTRSWEPEWGDGLKEWGISLAVQTYRGGLQRYPDARQLIRRVESWQPDVVYHRFDLYYIGLPRLLKMVPSILEINSNDLTEMRFGGHARYMYHLLTRGKVLKAAKGFVFVSGEIAGAAHYKRYVKSKSVIGNGFAMKSAALAPVRVPQGEQVRLLFIGTPGQPWHGVDAIASLAEIHKDWRFDMVGISSTDLAAPLPGNMFCHGKMTGPEYEPLMLQADIAIGSLALYRNKMKEASPLKVREYLAYGLPVIIGYKDTDFPDPVPFILEIPNEQGSTRTALKEIEAFVQSWRGRRVERSRVEHLDTTVKEAARVKYMQSIAAGGGSR